MLSLKGKIAVVMGCGSSGPGWSNGKATAVLLARQGAHAALFLASDEARYATGTEIVVDGGNALT